MLFTFPLYAWLQDEISSPLSAAQIFELCNPELFPEALQNSEVTSSSNCCYEENSSYATNILDVETKFNNSNSNNNVVVTTPSSTNNINNNNNNNNNNNSNTSNNLSVIFDSQEEIDNDISASIDFSLSPSFNVTSFLPVTSTQQVEQFDFNSHVQQLTACSSVEGFSQYHNPNDPVAPLMGAPLSLPPVFEEDCITSVPSYVPLNPSSPSCNYLSSAGMAAYMPNGPLTTALSADSSGLFGGNILLGSELQTQELDYQGDSGRIFCADPIQRVFNPPDLQVSTNSKLVS